MKFTTLWGGMLSLTLLAGCTQFPYGWKQEKELLSHWGTSVTKGQQNEVDPILPSFSIGFHKEFHDWHFFDDVGRGTGSDWERVTTP